MALAPPLRAALDAHGFTPDAVDGLLGTNGGDCLERGDRSSLDLLLGDGRPLTTLVRLFVAELPAELPAAVQALAPTRVEALLDAGLTTLDGGLLRSEVTVAPVDGLLLASDLRGRAERTDFVMRVSATTVALAGLTIRRPVRTALDIGSGSGFQALLGAAHSERVVGIDANQRAVAFARFNARLNGVDNVVFAEGDLFDHLEGGPFDLIVSNPPFVVSPGLDHLFRDSGREGDAACAHLAGSIAAALAPGGTGQFLANWPVTSAGWAEHVAGWFAGSGCDVWVLHETTEAAAVYVSKWLGETGSPRGPEHDAWMAWLRRHEVVGVGYGLITMRKRAGGRPGRVRIEDAPDRYTFPCGAELECEFDRILALEGQTDTALLRRAWRPAPSLVVAESDLAEPRARPCFEARLARGLCWRQPLDLPAAMVLGGCDGAQRLEAVIAGVAVDFAVDPDLLTRSVLPSLRPLMRHGLLLNEPPRVS